MQNHLVSVSSFLEKEEHFFLFESIYFPEQQVEKEYSEDFENEYEFLNRNLKYLCLVYKRFIFAVN